MKLKFNIVLACIFFTFTGLIYAQESEESVGRAAARADTAGLHAMYLDSAAAYARTDIEKSLEFIAESMSLITAANNQDLWAKSLVDLGKLYLYHGQVDLAVSNLEEGYKIDGKNSTGIILGQSYLQNQNFDKARKLFSFLQDKNYEVPYREIEVYEGLGDAHFGLGDFNAAISNYQKGLSIANQNRIGPKISSLNSKIALAYESDNQEEPASVYYENTLESSKNLPPAQAVREREKVADFYKKKNRRDEEISLRKESLDQLGSQPQADVQMNLQRPQVNQVDTVSTQSINYKIADAYAAQEDYDQAINYLEESLEQAGAEADLEVQKDATRALSEVYRKKGDYTRALESYRQYVQLVDTIYARKEQQIAQATKLNLDIINQQNRIMGLERERQLSQSRYDLAIAEQQLIGESNKRQRWIIYSLIIVLALTALLAYFFYRSTRQQKLANNLLALKSLRTQMNPHFIFNALNSVNHYIAQNDERKANAYLTDFSGLMRAVLEHSEADFIPLSQEIEVLTKYLKLEHSRFPEKFSYSIVVDKKLNPEEFRIPPMLLQPYLENAVWHGLRYKEKKGKLTLEFQQTQPGRLVVTIKDNGIGRKKSAELKTENQLKKKSRALKNIEKRIEILNGMYPEKIGVQIADLNKDSSGTQVVITLDKNG